MTSLSKEKSAVLNMARKSAKRGGGNRPAAKPTTHHSDSDEDHVEKKYKMKETDIGLPEEDEFMAAREKVLLNPEMDKVSSGKLYFPSSSAK